MLTIRSRQVPVELEIALRGAGFSQLHAKLYAARGIASAKELEHELKNLLPFSLLKNAAEMGARLADAITAGQRMLIVGDYDCDGATATTLGMKGLAAFGAKIDFIVPNRFEYGYGLTPEIVALAAERQPDIIITVDNGIASHAGVEAARKLGIEVLITDHHLPADTLPNALIVNPNQPDCEFPSKNLAGVGVMFYVLMALRAELRSRGAFAEKSEPNLAQWLDIVALGTVADVVKLDANNRILVEQGLKRMRSGRACPGIMALFSAAGRYYGRASCFDLGFALGPRLNAAGRLDDMSFGINTLLAATEEAALPLAKELDQLNRARREIEHGMREEAELALASVAVEDSYSICLYNTEWHQGVVGIVASRMKDRFNRPTIVFADGNEGEIKGSGRSIAGLHLRDALDLVSKRFPHLIRKFGGHAMAAGLSLHVNDFVEFKSAFETVCRELLDESALTRVIETDGELPEDAFVLETAEALDKQVWGQGFPAPVFQGVFRVVEQRIVGEKHSKLKLATKQGIVVEAMKFNWCEPIPRDCLAVYKVSVNEFRGERMLQLQLDHSEAA
ncbi:MULTISPECIES: single-stranded-DNA-specific exonuclease RecJ [Deefgea]|uniref:Single-stranded-DNA-specific exonuclease RecJ n=1 Tax=Deefgea chitinilytica TaxID=570276 RepID=A0ABS2CB12_9NEIS|nr:MULTISPECIES: single-stranded-DNA-specific exonuclease RecJ [Deefgea]MBM5570561.1 single-stranded-DNA-specific exonuclease RecJ [Deefgea chitinilytica]MBM9887790.1 single-stranded-DNA-specific exonuclease RecJ [Deefgea sp. CFH1-16]